MKDGSRGAGTGGARQRVRSALVVVEVALAVVLLVGAALFIGSFVTLMRIDPGFDPRNVLTVQVSPRFAPGSIAGVRRIPHRRSLRSSTGSARRRGCCTHR